MVSKFHNGSRSRSRSRSPKHTSKSPSRSPKHTSRSPIQSRQPRWKSGSVQTVSVSKTTTSIRQSSSSRSVMLRQSMLDDASTIGHLSCDSTQRRSIISGDTGSSDPATRAPRLPPLKAIQTPSKCEPIPPHMLDSVRALESSLRGLYLSLATAERTKTDHREMLRQVSNRLESWKKKQLKLDKSRGKAQDKITHSQDETTHGLQARIATYRQQILEFQEKIRMCEESIASLEEQVSQAELEKEKEMLEVSKEYESKCATISQNIAHYTTEKSNIETEIAKDEGIVESLWKDIKNKEESLAKAKQSTFGTNNGPPAGRLSYNSDSDDSVSVDADSNRDSPLVGNAASNDNHGTDDRVATSTGIMGASQEYNYDDLSDLDEEQTEAGTQCSNKGGVGRSLSEELEELSKAAEAARLAKAAEVAKQRGSHDDGHSNNSDAGSNSDESNNHQAQQGNTACCHDSVSISDESNFCPQQQRNTACNHSKDFMKANTPIDYRRDDPSEIAVRLNLETWPKIEMLSARQLEARVAQAIEIRHNPLVAGALSKWRVYTGFRQTSTNFGVQYFRYFWADILGVPNNGWKADGLAGPKLKKDKRGKSKKA